MLDGFQHCHKYLTPASLVEVFGGLDEKLQVVNLVPGEPTPAAPVVTEDDGEGGADR